MLQWPWQSVSGRGKLPELFVMRFSVKPYELGYYQVVLQSAKLISPRTSTRSSSRFSPTEQGILQLQPECINFSADIWVLRKSTTSIFWAALSPAQNECEQETAMAEFSMNLVEIHVFNGQSSRSLSTKALTDPRSEWRSSPQRPGYSASLPWWFSVYSVSLLRDLNQNFSK